MRFFQFPSAKFSADISQRRTSARIRGKSGCFGLRPPTPQRKQALPSMLFLHKINSLIEAYNIYWAHLKSISCVDGHHEDTLDVGREDQG